MWQCLPLMFCMAVSKWYFFFVFCYPLCSCCLFIIIIIITFNILHSLTSPTEKAAIFFHNPIEGNTAVGLFLFLKLFPWFLHPQYILMYMYVGIMAIVDVRMLWKVFFLSYIPKYPFICYLIDLIVMLGES